MINQINLTTVHLWVDLKEVPDHLFSHNVLIFFRVIIGKTIKFHLNKNIVLDLILLAL